MNAQLVFDLVLIAAASMSLGFRLGVISGLKQALRIQKEIFER